LSYHQLPPRGQGRKLLQQQQSTNLTCVYVWQFLEKKNIIHTNLLGIHTTNSCEQSPNLSNLLFCYVFRFRIWWRPTARACRLLSPSLHVSSTICSVPRALAREPSRNTMKSLKMLPVSGKSKHINLYYLFSLPALPAGFPYNLGKIRNF